MGFGGQLSFFGLVPCGAEGFATWYDRDFDERVGELEEPAYGGVSCLVASYGASLFEGHDPVLLFEASDYSVDGVLEVLLVDEAFGFAGGG